MERRACNNCVLFLPSLAHTLVSRWLYCLQFTIPDTRSTITATTISNIIQHTEIVAGYRLEVHYYRPDCQGPIVTTIPKLADTFVTTGSGTYTTTVTNTFANILDNHNSPFANPTYFEPDTGANPQTAKYQYCIEFVIRELTSGQGKIKDQERYKVSVAASLSGAVTTDATVVTDIDTPEETEFGASVTVCDEDSGALVTSNFFKGDSITFCFTSNSFPSAKIIDLDTFTLRITGASSGIDVKPDTTVGVTSAYVTPAGGSLLNCNVAAGVATCRLTVALIGTVLTSALFPALQLGDPTDRPVTASGALVMKFGNTRRKAVRVLLKDGDIFRRNAKTAFVVTVDQKGKSCNCGGFFLFYFICWFFKCFLGWF
jgi:hypothetical protein